MFTWLDPLSSWSTGCIASESWSCFMAVHGSVYPQVNPNIRKEKWSEAEDDNLTRLYYVYGNAWAEISRNMNGRTDQQCMVKFRTMPSGITSCDQWASSSSILRFLVKHDAAWSPGDLQCTFERYIPGARHYAKRKITPSVVFSAEGVLLGCISAICRAAGGGILILQFEEIPGRRKKTHLWWHCTQSMAASGPLLQSRSKAALPNNAEPGESLSLPVDPKRRFSSCQIWNLKAKVSIVQVTAIQPSGWLIAAFSFILNWFCRPLLPCRTSSSFPFLAYCLVQVFWGRWYQTEAGNEQQSQNGPKSPKNIKTPWKKPKHRSKKCGSDDDWEGSNDSDLEGTDFEAEYLIKARARRQCSRR